MNYKATIVNIPNVLKNLNRWVNWKLEPNPNNPEKPRKLPIDPKNGRYAEVNNESTWSSFEVVTKFNAQKIGFVFTDTEIVGIDVDYLVDNPICQEILEKFKNTYCEVSPNGKMHVLCYGNPKRTGKGSIDKKIEIYDKTSPRYFTVTGNHIEGTPDEIVNCQTALDWLHEKYFLRESNNPTSNFFNKPNPTPQFSTRANYGLSDDEIFQKCTQAKNASKFEALWSGEGNADESSGDLALAGLFAFYTKDSAQIDRLMRQSNRKNLHNGKWNTKHSTSGDTYGQMTMNKAISNAGTYIGSVSSSVTDSVSSSVTDGVASSVTDWHQKLAYSTKQNGELMIKSNLYNMAVIMENDENLQGLFGFNEFTGKVKIVQDSQIIGLKSGGDLEDNDITQVRVYVSESLKDFNSHLISWESGEMINAIVYIARKNYNFHPVKDYLNALEWDGTERINHFFNDHCGTHYNEYSAFVARSFFISAVARIMEPGCKVDTMVILEGVQGIGKSSLFRALCDQEAWFRDSAIDLDSKDAYTGLRGKWVIEMAELDAMNKSETTRIKSFITSQSDSYRPPYGKCDIDVARQCVFAGTTNKSNYLKDETGNRRFLPVKCEHVDIEAITANREQLWAEAVHHYRSGEKWYVEKDDTPLNNVIAEQQEARYEGDAWEDAIRDWAENRSDFTISFLAQDALGFKLQDIDRRIEIRIGKTLQSLGYKQSQKRVGGKRYRVYNKLL